MPNADADLVVRARAAVTPDGIRPVAVVVRGGAIAELLDIDTPVPAVSSIELEADEVLLPGLVDSHVHVNDPGRTEWEGFATATAAAAAGGVLTIVDMPLNSIPPTVNVDALELKRTTARDQVRVDVGFWGGAVPGNLADLRPLHDAGVFGFKCFLLPSGVDEFPPLDAAQLRAAMTEIASFGGLLIVHAEDPHVVRAAPNDRAYSAFLESRPRLAENRAIEGLLDLARETGCRVHVLHLSSAEALPQFAAAKKDGLAVTVETCPHYLCFAADEIPDGATQFKCCPPIRDEANRDELWQGLGDGVIDLVVSDHSPSTLDLKHLDTGDFGTAWGGIASLQLGLPAIWTEARARGFQLTDVVRWMATAPAALTGLVHKGSLAIGNRADLTVLAPDETFVVDAAALEHRNPITPYQGRTLSGVVRRTWLGGAPTAERPVGRLLVRGES